MEMKKKIYVSATAHLDTIWLWDLQTSIRQYLPETFNRNFMLFEKYPDYKFSFEGSYRYELIEEYYPEAFKKIQKYAADGRWFPAGSCYENGDVNIPSPEALIRNIIYGSMYFKAKLGVTSNDIYLPDCFGFGAALPSIAAHTGLKGFISGKLSWGSANGIPFDIGKWYGNDGNYIYAAIKPGSYCRSFKEMRTNKEFIDKLNYNIANYNLPYTYTYTGTGDRGGSPAEESVKCICEEASKNNSSDTEIIVSSSSQLFDDLSDLSEIEKVRMPSWHGELLMTSHGPGSYTSRAIGKRWNRRNEQLADAAERSASIAGILNGYVYPQESLERAWKRVLSHHFHDDITGTSITDCYRKNWNDYVVSMNAFASEYASACEAISTDIDTSFCEGKAIMVNNVLQWECNEAVCISIKSGKNYVRVFDCSGKEVPSQVTAKEGDILSVVFSAKVPGTGYAVYDIRESDEPCKISTSLTVKGNKAENNAIRFEINSNGDISHLYDKKAGIEMLRSPIRLALIDDKGSLDYPAWEIDYTDLCRTVREFAKASEIKLIESGPARVVFKVIKHSKKSDFTQLIILDEGSEYVRVFNEVDWKESATMLKAIFNTKAENEEASYDIGLGCIRRKNNTEKLHECPAQMFADITDKSGNFGLSVFSDSKIAWDKPGDSLLRLTCIHTPMGSFRWQCAQHLMDLGLNRFSFGLFPHKNGIENGSVKYAAQFNQPLCAFEISTHKGKLNPEQSFAQVSDCNVIIRAIKKAENSDKIIVRFNETQGKSSENIHFSFCNGIKSAQEVNGLEEYIEDACVKKGELIFSIGENGIKTFALEVKKPKSYEKGTIIKLPFNSTVITTNENRFTATTKNGLSIPAEIIPDSIISGGTEFLICKDEKNAMFGDNQSRVLPDGSSKLHLLVLCMKESKLRLLFDGHYYEKMVPASTEYIGTWDMIARGETGRIRKDEIAFASTHTHSMDKDIPVSPLYVFKYSFDIPKGTVSFRILPNEDLYLLSATATKGEKGFKVLTELYDSLEKREYNYTLTATQKRLASPMKLEEKVYEKIDITTTKHSYTSESSHARQITDKFAGLRRKFNGNR